MGTKARQNKDLRNLGRKFCLLPVFLINNMRDVPILDKFVRGREVIQIAY
jgi:hypothetical protein